ncbi:hypothetical protein SCHPADRAFT_933065 [Schizopora paradoxa]|uniref:Uncharacterized protein n=1 Tax=Schizopora paradoxa TaxID=27342 RepID=A0A0H2R3Q6_9AGAM|nr:hypothetical protein SCHPADRAFT_933065 [Schizopora paradoxa]
MYGYGNSQQAQIRNASVFRLQQIKFDGKYMKVNFKPNYEELPSTNLPDSDIQCYVWDAYCNGCYREVGQQTWEYGPLKDVHGEGVTRAKEVDLKEDDPKREEPNVEDSVFVERLGGLALDTPHLCGTASAVQARTAPHRNRVFM